jgi:Ca-activated chloride channel family protein|tara:strand:- start:2672 stop:3616 length:945 start_codon:yes stop_codon:yes gene_type:complete
MNLADNYFSSVAGLSLIPALVLFGVARWRWGRSIAIPISSISTVEVTKTKTRRVRYHWLAEFILWLSALIVIIALAGPQYGIASNPTELEGLDIVLTIDLSSSMNLKNMDGDSKLVTAQQVISEFLEEQDGNRIGVVVFQSSALTLSPLTYDIDAVDSQIDRLETGWLKDGTAIGLGISEALVLLRNSSARSKVIILLTDGENNAGVISPLEAAELSKAFNTRIYTIALTPNGQFFESRTLQSISEVTGGKGFDAYTREDLLTAYSTVADLERSNIGVRDYVVINHYQTPFILVSIALLFVSFMLSVTYFKRFP